MSNFKWQEKIEAKAARLGGYVEWEHNGLCLEAPAGKVWDCDDLHGLVASWDDSTGRAHALADLWERAQFGEGLIDCPFDNCDTCGEGKA